MISARLISVFVVIFAFAFVLSNPTPEDVALSKRADSTTVLAILTTIKLETDKILPELDSVVAKGEITDDNIRPHLLALVNTLVAAVKSLISLKLPIIFSPGASKNDIIVLAVQIASALAKSAVGLLLVLPNLLATLIYLVTALLKSLTGLN